MKTQDEKRLFAELANVANLRSMCWQCRSDIVMQETTFSDFLWQCRWQCRWQSHWQCQWQCHWHLNKSSYKPSGTKKNTGFSISQVIFCKKNARKIAKDKMQNFHAITTNKVSFMVANLIFLWLRIFSALVRIFFQKNKLRFQKKEFVLSLWMSFG